jgi:hypothetical protein
MIRGLLAGMLIVATLVTMTGCGRNSKPEEACNFVQNSEAHRVSWEDTTPAPLWIDSSVPSQYIPQIQDAVAQWNHTRGRELIRVMGQRELGEPATDGVSGVYWMADWETTRRYEQARTTVYWAGDRIYEADIRVNARDFKYATTEIAGTIDVESLLVHELGHVLGLAHNEESGSVMAKALPDATERRNPGAVDISSLQCEY